MSLTRYKYSFHCCLEVSERERTPWIHRSVRQKSHRIDVVDDEDRDYFVLFVFGVLMDADSVDRDTPRNSVGVKRARNCQRALREMGAVMPKMRSMHRIENRKSNAFNVIARYSSRSPRSTGTTGWSEQDKKCCIARVPNLILVIQ